MSLVIYNLDLYRRSIQVVIAGKLVILETLDDTLYLRNKKIKSVWIRTINDLHTTTLDISHNLLTFFPDMFSLRYLDCSNCQIKEMPVYMPVLQELNCSNNLIVDLPKYPKLEVLDCSGNPLCSLPDFPNLKLIARNCPILVLHDNPTYYRRSGIVRGGKFQWIHSSNIEHKYVIIDWQNAKTKILFSRPFTQKLAGFLFYL